MKLRTTLCLLACLPLFRSAEAQVFIADTSARAILNDLIPGIVDGAGIMDTLNPGITTLDSAVISLSPYDEVQNVSISGLQYLDALVDLIMVYNPMASDLLLTQVEALPPSLHSLHMLLDRGDVDLPQLPSMLRYLQLSGHFSDETTVNIAGMPDTLDQMFISETLMGALWPDTPYVNMFSMSDVQGDMSLGQVEAGNVSVMVAFDPIEFLPAIHTPVLYLDGCVIPEGFVWPEGIRKLDLWSASYETTWGIFPESLDSLTMDGVVGCLEWLPDGLSYFLLHYYQPGYDCFPNWPSSLPYIDIIAGSDTLFEDNVEYCSVLNTACPGPWPGISGHILMDTNLNGQCDPGEPALPQVAMTLLPTGYVTGCDANGYWEIGVQPGSYTITPSSAYPYFQSITPTQHTADLPTMGGTDTLNDFAVTLIPDMQDLRAHFYSEPPRPGFVNRLQLTCENYGTVPVDAELTLTFTTDQTWVGSSLAPDAQTATSATWQFGTMAIGASQQFTVDLNTDASVPLGTPVEYTLSALPTAGDETPLDNLIVFPDTVVGSYDPNDKLVRPSALSPAAVQAGQTPIGYTIRFQNTGTAAAERVVIVDTLPAGLQPQSIEFLSSSHPCHWYVLDGVLHVIHEGINLPDSASDAPGSQGYVQFRILPDTDLMDGETVTNIAHIVFDFNEPIITPPAVFRVDVLASVEEPKSPGISIVPNPARDQVRVVPAQGSALSFRYQLRDMPGRTIMTGRTDVNGTISIGALPNGPYLLGVERGGAWNWTRLVKE